MKVTDLMLYDWVILNGSKYRVMDFDSDGIISDYCLGEPSRHEINFEPIPLTAEILNANGFELIDKGDYGEWKIKENPNIPFLECNGFTIFCGIEIKYVHQLQHALRLCDLNDIADNFKLPQL